MQVRITSVDPAAVFNLTSPRYLSEVSARWRGKLPWHDAKYEPVRDLMESLYVAGFNKFSSHFKRLEDSIAKEGIRNPVLLTSGPLIRRKITELPPAVLADPMHTVCEWVGGSRLYVAGKMGLTVPAIINDGGGAFCHAPLIPPGTDLRTFFRDQPKQYGWLPNGCAYFNYLPYSHFPERERHGAARAQQVYRQTLIREICTEVAHWRTQHD